MGGQRPFSTLRPPPSTAAVSSTTGAGNDPLKVNSSMHDLADLPRIQAGD